MPCFCGAVPATVDKTQRDLSPVVVAGGTRTLDCVVDGVPTPRRTWLRDGAHLSLANHTNVRVTLDGRHLQITMATMNDSAVYQCRVANEAGRDDIAYNLSVHGIRTALTSLWAVYTMRLSARSSCRQSLRQSRHVNATCNQIERPIAPTIDSRADIVALFKRTCNQLRR